MFKELLSVKDVRGVLMLSAQGDIGHQEFGPAPGVDPQAVDWHGIVEKLPGVREAEFVFEQMRLYVRGTANGYLVVVMGLGASSAMVRLNCDLVISALQKSKGDKGLKRFLKK